MDNVTLLAAFVAGVLSFISPCVLPLIPGYLSFVSGVTMGLSRQDRGRSRDRTGSSGEGVISGALLMVIGVLIFTNRFAIIAGFLNPYLPTF